MKRLTGKYENGTAYYNIVPGESTIDRLAAIEDILGDEYDLDRLRELAQADREGRVEIIEPDVYAGLYRYYNRSHNATGGTGMKEYIEREAVEEMLESAQTISDGEYCGYCTEDINLSSIPAADVAPVRHGKWIRLQHSGTIVCGNCGRNIRKNHGNDYADFEPYCPSCGSLMDTKEENNLGTAL